MSVHAGIHALSNVFRERVRRHGDDRDGRRPRILQFADRPRGLESVHLRHLDIHKDQGIFSFFRLLHLFHTDAAVFGALRRDSEHVEHGGNDLPVDVVILRDEDVQALQVGVIVFRLDRFCLGPQERVDLIVQLGAEQRLADKAVCAGFLRHLFDIR